MTPRRRPTYQGRRDRPAKRPKVESSAVEGGTAIKAKVPKRKYALIFGYKGTAYNGLQRQLNEGGNVKTVEGVLVNALRAINAISEAQLADPIRLHWARVGRTDSGVHAACQVICAKLSLGPLTDEDKKYVERAKAKVETEKGVCPEQDNDKKETNSEEENPASPSEHEGDHERMGKATLVDEDKHEETDDVVEENQPSDLQRIRELRFLTNLRALLPDDIEIYDVVRVWGSWDARMRAGRRVYEYCLPVRALQKVRIRDNREAFLHFCKLRGVEDGEKKHCPFELKQKLFAALQTKDSSIVDQLKNDFSEEGLGTICERWRTEMSTIRKTYFITDTEGRINLWKEFKCEPKTKLEKPPYPPSALSSFHNIPYVTEEAAQPFTDENLAEFQEILEMYKGSHHWFNYTSKISAHDRTGQRFIEDIKAYRIKQDEDLVVVRIIGQSFLLNQIRKMIAVALETYMGLTPWTTIQDLLTPPLEPKRHVHLAPGEGLLLERVFFDLHDRQNRISAGKLILHHPFELKDPHGEIMNTFLNTGTYPNVKEDFINDHGVFKKGDEREKKVNLLLEEPPAKEDQDMPATLTLDIKEKTTLPIWAQILLFKHKELHPWIVNLFKNTDKWRQYLSDVLWHPFVLENYPTPLQRYAPSAGNNEEQEQNEEINDASATEA